MDLKNNQGVLFKNEKTKDTHPDFTGELKVEGKTYRIALWKKTSSKGTMYLSVSVEDLRDREKHREEPKKEAGTAGQYLDEKKDSFYDNLDDAIPF